MRIWLAILAALPLAGCASTLPQAVREAPPDNPELSAVLADPAAFRGREVRWGGTIARTDNRERETCVEVVERGLGSNGRPNERDSSDGRFLACVDGFLDPVIYTQGRAITVYGTLAGSRSGRVGDYDYTYPLVRVGVHHLWQPQPEPVRYVVEPDPLWSPWGPYWRYPYGRFGYPYHWRY